VLEMSDHDHIFWLGDLNYRINEEMDVVYSKIAGTVGIVTCVCILVFQSCFGSEQDWDYLLTHDQLNIERAAGRTFKGFQEGQITFAPTYKYQPGTSVYERREVHISFGRIRV
jgi:phosphatidylinositol-bisphosphatase